MNPSRRKFLTASALSAGTFLLPGNLLAQNERPPAIDSKVVNEFVKVAHNDFNRMKVLLEEYPHLLNAAWDWGNGDFETAIGAAGHMGLRDYALYLIEKGARADIFVLTMLGKTEIVKTTLESYPTLLQSIGPHGFTLLHHAKQGGAESEELYTYLESKGLDKLHIKTF